MEKSSLCNIITNYFGEDRVDFQSRSLAGNKKEHRAVIHFPSVEVRNKKGYKHTIKDVYIRINFVVGPTDAHLKYIEFGRATYTRKEIEAGYKFSHTPCVCISSGDVPFENFSQYSTLCFGSGDFARLVDACTSTLNPVHMSMLCGGLDAYLSWESVDTTPYIRMESIFRDLDPDKECNTETCNPIKKQLYDPLIQQLIPLVTWKVETSALGVQTFEVANSITSLCLDLLSRCKEHAPLVFEQLISRSIYNVYYDPEKHKFFYSNKNSAFWQHFWEKNNEPNPQSTDIIFKGKNIPLTIIKDEGSSEEFSLFGIGVAPSIVNFLIKRLSSDLNTFLDNEENKTNSTSGSNGKKS